MTMQMTAGQNVKKNRRPGPMGLGFGSGQRPTAAATMMKERARAHDQQAEATLVHRIADRRMSRAITR